MKDKSSSLKTTGLPWIPFINSAWKIVKVKNCFKISKLKAKSDNPVILSLARDGIKVRDISTNEGQLAANYSDYNPVLPGDLLLNPMDLYSGANCNMSEISGVISPAYSDLRAVVPLNPKFFDYYFKTQYWSMAMFAHGKGVSFDNRWTLNSDGLLNYEIPFPPLERQNEIVGTLKQKLRTIDFLIQNETKQIEKLEEYKKVVITKAVTKGLDPNAKMKDSGVEWIGNIPEKWQINRIKYISFSNPDSLSDSESESLIINYVDIGSVSLENGIERTETYSFENAPSRARRVLKKGDVIISMVRTYLKAIAVVDRNGLTGSTGFCALRPIVDLIDSNFLGYYCKSNVFTDEISKRSFGISYPAITSTQLISLYLTFPPFKDQQQIACYLDNVCGKINKIIVIKKSKIEKLQAYKKSLIYEYVTGKKAVGA